jgi:uncharacterized protein YegP (UPF0339 family)
MTLEFYKDKADKHRWRVKSDNGEIIGASSQGFASKQMALKNAELLNNALTNCNHGGG